MCVCVCVFLCVFRLCSVLLFGRSMVGLYGLEYLEGGGGGREGFVLMPFLLLLSSGEWVSGIGY